MRMRQWRSMFYYWSSLPHSASISVHGMVRHFEQFYNIFHYQMTHILILRWNDCETFVWKPLFLNWTGSCNGNAVDFIREVLSSILDQITGYPILVVYLNPSRRIPE
jgi:hypothetical protein